MYKLVPRVRSLKVELMARCDSTVHQARHTRQIKRVPFIHSFIQSFCVQTQMQKSTLYHIYAIANLHTKPACPAIEPYSLPPLAPTSVLVLHTLQLTHSPRRRYSHDQVGAVVRKNHLKSTKPDPSLHTTDLQYRRQAKMWCTAVPSGEGSAARRGVCARGSGVLALAALVRGWWRGSVWLLGV
jgi:hypothetical protein